MQYSINEIENLLAKAARGGGAPAGQASAFGKAAALHIARGCDLADVRAALDDLPTGAILDCYAQLQRCLSGGETTIPCATNDLIRSYALALPYMGVESETNISIDMAQFEKVKLSARVTINADVVNNWRALAALTFVPETEQSRIGGAGAGLTDND